MPAPLTMAEAIAANQAREAENPPPTPREPTRIGLGRVSHACLGCGERFYASRGTECPTCRIPLMPERKRRRG